MIKNYSFKSFVKDLAVMGISLFILLNILSYIRAPKHSTNLLPYLGVELVEDKPLVVHFWATWCPTCNLENSTIEKLSKEYNVITVAVSSGTDEQIKEYMKENNFTFKVINDDTSTLANIFQVEAFPTTFIYNKNHELRFTEVGFTSYVGFKARLHTF